MFESCCFLREETFGMTDLHVYHDELVKMGCIKEWDGRMLFSNVTQCVTFLASNRIEKSVHNVNSLLSWYSTTKI